MTELAEHPYIECIGGPQDGLRIKKDPSGIATEWHYPSDHAKIPSVVVYAILPDQDPLAPVVKFGFVGYKPIGND